MMSSITPGIYLHYKGNQYEVIGTATHSETEEEHVIYFAVKTPDRLWIRPLAMFSEEIETDGKRVQRFAKIQES